MNEEMAKMKKVILVMKIQILLINSNENEVIIVIINRNEIINNEINNDN